MAAITRFPFPRTHLICGCSIPVKNFTLKNGSIVPDLLILPVFQKLGELHRRDPQAFGRFVNICRTQRAHIPLSVQDSLIYLQECPIENSGFLFTDIATIILSLVKGSEGHYQVINPDIKSYETFSPLTVIVHDGSEVPAPWVEPIYAFVRNLDLQSRSDLVKACRNPHTDLSHSKLAKAVKLETLDPDSNLMLKKIVLNCVQEDPYEDWYKTKSEYDYYFTCHPVSEDPSQQNKSIYCKIHSRF